MYKNVLAHIENIHTPTNLSHIEIIFHEADSGTKEQAQTTGPVCPVCPVVQLCPVMHFEFSWPFKGFQDFDTFLSPLQIDS